jgi:hypothetical protein
MLRSREKAWIETLSRSASKLYNGPERRGRPKQIIGRRASPSAWPCRLSTLRA